MIRCTPGWYWSDSLFSLFFFFPCWYLSCTDVQAEAEMVGAVGDGPSVSLVSFYNRRYLSTPKIIPFVCSVLLKSSQFRLEFVHPAANFFLCFLLYSRICATALGQLNNGFQVIGILVIVEFNFTYSCSLGVIYRYYLCK